jgi:hypothetical protein
MPWYLVAGAGLIVFSVWLPWLAAARTTRVERRAERIASLLLIASRELPPADLAADGDLLQGRFWRLCGASGEHVDDLEVVVPPLPGTLLVLRNKHYAFQLAMAPIPPDAVVARDAVPTREVLAWPLAATGPGHCVFFHAEATPRAYTRNLTANYRGLGAYRPPPGAAQAPVVSGSMPAHSYRARGDERWILY